MTNQELREYSDEHLLYEVWMLYRTGTEDLTFVSQFVRNAIIESYALHLRNLITFFYPTRNQKQTDIYAKHYLPDDTGSNMPSITTTLDQARERCHKVGHIAEGRITDRSDPKKSWNRLGLTREVFLLLKWFSENSDTEKLGPKVRDFVSKIVV